MIPWFGAAFLLFGFLILIRLFDLAKQGSNAVSIARHSYEVIRSAELSDDDKEATLQKNSLQLFRLSLLLGVGGMAALLIPIGILYACDRAGWISLDAVFSVALSPVFLIAGGVLGTLAFIVPKGNKQPKGNYSALERGLHKVAFNTSGAQVSLADLEDRQFAKQLSPHSADRPVFITGLPRAGTTVLLECCSDLPEFASHCYRDMPFVLIPCLWARFSASFQKHGELHERAHGDGMLINYDSSEALEEVIWKYFWRKHYQSDRIIPWRSDEDDDEFAEFFRNHMRKIIMLRGGEEGRAKRYLSKNNLNIARIGLLRRLFPESVIVVPFRHPLHQASSLLEQHRNFLRIHEEDPFAREYMRAIGHYDFGMNLCPVDFDGWFDKRRSQDSQCLSFWLEYWTAAYGHLLAESGEVLFVNYEALCEKPESVLRRLNENLELDRQDALISAAAKLHPSRAREIDTSSVDPAILREVNDIHAALMQAAAR